MKYELDYHRHHDNWLCMYTAVLTGLSDIEIMSAIKSPYVGECKRYNGRQMISLLRLLGMNTNNRFVKFDPNTEYPCLFKFKDITEKNKTYIGMYHDNMIYWGAGHKASLKQFNFTNKNCKITSMLQVWI